MGESLQRELEILSEGFAWFGYGNIASKLVKTNNSPTETIRHGCSRRTRKRNQEVQDQGT